MAFAEATFSSAQLGDSRRTDRLVLMAMRAAEKPAGKLSVVFEDDAELQAAYDWVENPAIDPAEVMAARHAATVQRCQGLPMVFVPTDGSSLTITDKNKDKGTGEVGSGRSRTRGDHVHSAIAVTTEGTPMGLCGQVFWTRKRRAPARKKKSTRSIRAKEAWKAARAKDARKVAKARGAAKTVTATQPHRRLPVEQKETRYWLEVRDQARKAFQEHAPGTRVWFQHDRGADAWPVLADMVGVPSDEWTTVRAAWDRRLLPEAEAADDEPTRHLHDALLQTSIFDYYKVVVPAGRKRQAREATMAVRACEVALDLRDRRTDRHHPAKVYAVLAYEVGTTPADEEPLAWVLLTTYEVKSFEAACLVVYGYTLRWRIEGYHATLKTSCCNAEDTQLRRFPNRVRWYAILGAVAMRIERLTYLAREKPDEPATTEFSQHEIEAMRDLRKRGELPPTEQLTIAQAVDWVAHIGGYTGKSSGGPPGRKTLARGLVLVEAVALAYQNRAIREGHNRKRTPQGRG
jgi:hypothetical protein